MLLLLLLLLFLLFPYVIPTRNSLSERASERAGGEMSNAFGRQNNNDGAPVRQQSVRSVRSYLCGHRETRQAEVERSSDMPETSKDKRREPPSPPPHGPAHYITRGHRTRWAQRLTPSVAKEKEKRNKRKTNLTYTRLSPMYTEEQVHWSRDCIDVCFYTGAG
jgi:hypothetical protein